MKPFVPHFLLRNRHAMTLVASKWPRHFPRLPRAAERLFETEPGTKLLGDCFWQPDPKHHPTLMMVHGLEGSSDSTYMRGTAEKAWAVGFNVVLMNQRNCHGTEHLTPELYNSGLSSDYRAVVLELVERDGLPEIFCAGHSMGGNLVLKMAGEFGDVAPAALRGLVAVSPTLHLASCADALAEPQNAFYEWNFVRNLKKRYRTKVRLFPNRYELNGLEKVSTIREFDDAITAPYSGYLSADDYYYRASALRVADRIRVPTLILTSEDDPFVPVAPFSESALRENSNISIVIEKQGGHCGFLSSSEGDERYWAEARIVEFCLAHASQ